MADLGASLEHRGFERPEMLPYNRSKSVRRVCDEVLDRSEAPPWRIWRRIFTAGGKHRRKRPGHEQRKRKRGTRRCERRPHHGNRVRIGCRDFGDHARSRAGDRSVHAQRRRAVARRRIACRRHFATCAVVSQYREHLADSAAAVAPDEFAAAREAPVRRQRIALVLTGIAARIRSGEVELAIAPSASARVTLHVRRSETANIDRQSIRDTRPILDPPRNPLSSRTLEHVSIGVIGDNESATVTEINVVLPGTALSIALDQRTDNFSRLARILRALEPEPHEIHSEQARRRQRLARKHSFVADRYPILVEAMLETPQPEGPRADHGSRLRNLRNLEILAMNRRAFGMNSMRGLRKRLALIGRPVRVLGQQGRPSPRMRREHDHGIARRKRGSSHEERNCM